MAHAHQNSQNKYPIIAIGMAMFSMFFGSGNIIFPMFIGQTTQAQIYSAFVGFFLTAVLVPFLGLISMALFDGDYQKFFQKVGKIPGWLILIAIFGLIGPFALIPRCIVVAHSAVHTFVPTIELEPFSILGCILIYLCTYRKTKIVEILGLYLTPIKLIALFLILGISVLDGSALPAESSFSAAEAFSFGLNQGYNTMDIFSSFMFSGVILASIKQEKPEVIHSPKKLIALCLQAGFIGMGLLTIMYIGMCYASATHVGILEGVPKDKLFSILAKHALGGYAGIVISLAVTMSCLSTALTLSFVFTDFICKKVSRGRLPYLPTLVGTLVISFIISCLEFDGIQKILVPVLQISMPAMILLAFLNTLNKTIGFKFIREPVLATFFISLALFMIY